MDFYITKYQSKPTESMTLFFQAMALGIHRLEQEEAEEQSVRTALQAAAVLDNTAPEPPHRGGRRIQEDLANRARRLCIRIASQCNRCFWVSAAELTVDIISDCDCIQTHNNSTIFTRQLQ